MFRRLITESVHSDYSFPQFSVSYKSKSKNWTLSVLPNQHLACVFILAGYQSLRSLSASSELFEVVLDEVFEFIFQIRHLLVEFCLLLSDCGDLNILQALSLITKSLAQIKVPDDGVLGFLIGFKLLVLILSAFFLPPEALHLAECDALLDELEENLEAYEEGNVLHRVIDISHVDLNITFST